MKSRFFCMPSFTKAIQFGYIFLFFLKFGIKLPKNIFKKIYIKKDNNYDQFCDASESRANFWIYTRNQEHPKSSTRAYGASIGIN